MTKGEKALTDKLFNSTKNTVELRNKIVNTDNDKMGRQLDNELQKTKVEPLVF